MDAGALVPAVYRRLRLPLVKKNLLHLIPSFHQGGSERQALQLTRLLIEDGTYNVSLACLDKNGVLLNDAIELGLDEIPDFPLTSFYDLNMAARLRRFVKFLKDQKIDIVQTHDFYTNIFGMAGAGFAGVPVRIAAKRETGMRSSPQNFIERRAFGSSDVVVVNSERVRNFLADSGVPQRKMDVVYNGLDHRRFEISNGDHMKLANELGLPADGPRRFVTIVANLRERVKNHAMFLRAAAKAARTADDVGFIIAGEGELLDETKKLARDLGVSERTFFLGRCSRVPELLALSDICVLTSESEGFSNSILEYMAAGKPVVATDVGGAAEAIVEGETGFLVASNDDEALAERLGRLLCDSALSERMGSEGRRRVVEQFSMESQLNKTLAIYEREIDASDNE